jgi:2-oxoglutarate dehydrogenase E2 component (dihydrolipoamide succinyltransferase)
MSLEIKVPALPESVADATIAKWYKKPGDSIKRDENLVDIETDKVVLEVPATSDGILESITKPEGSTVNANEVIAILKPSQAGEAKVVEEKSSQVNSEPMTVTATPKSTPDHKTEILSPSVRRTSLELGVDTSTIQGSGKEGRITRLDVLRQGNVSNNVSPEIALSGDRPEQRVPMTRLRARIAERLLSAQQNMAILTTFNEINMGPAMDLRKNYKDLFEKTHKVRLGFMSFFLKAAVTALKRFPDVNAFVDGNEIVYHGYCDVGVAVSSERGLVVPILRNADQMSMAEIEAKIAEYGAKARDNKLTLEEMSGGTFTISNGGVFGSLLSTPIINPPQSAILGMHKIEERPIVENGQIVIRPMMYVALSYDHRIIDGKDSVSFLKTIKELIEDPARLILDV